MNELGPVSRHLEAHLVELARQRGILVWLDKEGTFAEFVARLHTRSELGAFPFPVRSYRGSFLALMLELDGLEEGVGMTPLVLYVPGYHRDQVSDTPLYEFVAPVQTMRPPVLSELIKEAAYGQVPVRELDAFLARENLTLAEADLWLKGLMDGSGHLPSLGGYSVEALFDGLAEHGELASQLASAAHHQAAWRRAEALLGLDRTRLGKLTGQSEEAPQLAHERAKRLREDMLAWALFVEFVHDLRRPPREVGLAPLKELPAAMVDGCRRLAEHLRERCAEYASLADHFELSIPGESEAASAEDLGDVDTFRFEDRKIMAAALEALAAANYRAAGRWAKRRVVSYWATRDHERRRGWQLLLHAAQLGLALVEDDKLLNGAQSLADAVERYRVRGYRVDAAQRALEQARQQATVLEIEEFPALRQRLDGLRVSYRAWADKQARAFNALCREHGFLPDAGLRQRELFEEVVRPALRDDAVTAYFVVDALRFEMAEQLASLLKSTRTGNVKLEARLSELPSVTEVGMNVLGPVARGGRLLPEFGDKGILGFRSQEKRIAVPEDRKKLMHERAGGRKCPWLSLEEVLSDEVTALRRSIGGARLVVVHAEGIDKAGEKGVGLLVFEQELQNLRAAWRQLYEAGVRHFVFTADHGFLLHDPVTRAPRARGFKTEPKRRHVITGDFTEQAGEVCVRARDLAYEGDDVYFVFPEDAAPFDLGERAKDFVHGGNSLQERVIPVLTVQHQYAPGAETARYRLEVKPQAQVARMHCIEAIVRVQSDTALSFSSLSEIELTLECPEAIGVKVQLCDARGARIEAQAIVAKVEEPFELFFKLLGPSEMRAPIQLRHATGAGLVAVYGSSEHYEVEQVLAMAPEPGAAPKSKPPAAKTASDEPPKWALALPEAVRAVFLHLQTHGSINAEEVTRMLGGPRAFNRFSLQFEDHAVRVPFRVRIEMTSGQKCYVREEG